MTIQLVEPVTRILVMTLGGEEVTSELPFPTLAKARYDGRHAACMRGTVRVRIVGADGTALCDYDRTDGVWRDHLRGKLKVTANERSCTCGWYPTVRVDKPMQYEPVLGWHWACSRCGASKFAKIEPRGKERIRG